MLQNNPNLFWSRLLGVEHAGGVYVIPRQTRYSDYSRIGVIPSAVSPTSSKSVHAELFTPRWAEWTLQHCCCSPVQWIRSQDHNHKCQQLIMIRLKEAHLNY